MRKIKNSKGFTLMEMLIVVAIIAILVAIAIPTFTSSLEKAREAADLANIRSAYAEAMVKYLDGSLTAEGVTSEKLTQTKEGWETSTSVPSYLTAVGSMKVIKNKAVKVIVDDEGVASFFLVDASNS